MFAGKVSSLKIHKEEASIVSESQECGICFSNESDIKFQPGDTVICYENIQKAGQLEWEPGYLDNSSQTLY